MFEFRNFSELHVDGYLHWLHGRADYFNSETYTKESPWDMGSKFGHLIYLVGLPVFYFTVLAQNYVSKNFHRYFIYAFDSMILIHFFPMILEKPLQAKKHEDANCRSILIAQLLSWTVLLHNVVLLEAIAESAEMNTKPI